MTYTNQQKRDIFYQAAANIDARPELYDFSRERVGDSDCPACMWGHVGRAAGMEKDTINYDIAECFVGCEESPPTRVLYNAGIGAYEFSASDAAKTLRRFADCQWPAEEQAMTFHEFMDSLTADRAES